MILGSRPGAVLVARHNRDVTAFVLANGSDIGDVIVVIVLIIITFVAIMILMVVLIMIVFIMIVFIMTVFIMTVGLMVMLVVGFVFCGLASRRLGGGGVAGRKDRSLCNGADRLLVHGHRIMMLVRTVMRFVRCALASLVRRLVAEGFRRRFGEALRLGVIGRLGMRLIGMIVMRVGVLFVRLAMVGVTAFRVGGLVAVDSLDDVALDALAAATATRAAVPVAPAVGAVLALLLGFAMRALLGLDQRLPIGDRDLVIVRMDFAEGQETMAVAAILDEGGLQRGFNAGDLRQVDVAPELLALGSFEIKFLDAVAADDNNPGLFRVGSIDQHLVGHIGTLGGDGRG